MLQCTAGNELSNNSKFTNGLNRQVTIPSMSGARYTMLFVISLNLKPESRVQEPEKTNFYHLAKAVLRYLIFWEATAFRVGE
jgi:hypothetical protein